ncbi:hypothetical protein BaRGS_00005707 [Batillaria attramentaria]|uniref:Uncharacterized protein n=1 Tax=Batillaria attramentaria TaxID=370345 RepID=A0ABD0LU89_9CAEN
MDLSSFTGIQMNFVVGVYNAFLSSRRKLLLSCRGTLYEPRSSSVLTPSTRHGYCSCPAHYATSQGSNFRICAERPAGTRGRLPMTTSHLCVSRLTSKNLLHVKFEHGS